MNIETRRKKESKAKTRVESKSFPKARAKAMAQGLPLILDVQESEFNKLPSGTKYMDQRGIKRTKP